ncbi:MAG TPA: tetratricopeptide repeat protein [Opitutaceae bacterium]|nr:tetratricopeptide repeat protein [Opitutaceae bacterium]
MNQPDSPAIPPSPRLVPLASLLLTLAVAAAYHNTLQVPFVFDDGGSITDNPTIRHLWPVWRALSPPFDETVTGRPLLNFTLALNYAVSGTSVWSYHVLNALIHLCAGLALFGVVRRTLVRSKIEKWRAAATPVGFGAALLWTLHPLQTEAVTYVIQRAESLMGLCYLLTFYGFVRSVDSPAPGRWRVFSVLCCLLGVASKEVTVTAPVLVLLYDRAFVAGSLAEAWRRRRNYYLWLAATWIFLGGLIATTGGNRGGTIGFGIGVAWWAYGLTQFQAVAWYLALSVWPHPLAFDYGTFWVSQIADVLPYTLIILPLATAALVALWRWPAAGFFGIWFFGILAPTSLVPGRAQMIVEHRMYLSLAALVVPAVLGLYATLGRRSLLVVSALAAALGWVTERRNAVYRTEESLWLDTIAKRPANPLAYTNLGCLLADRGHFSEAAARFTVALQLSPETADFHVNLGKALQGLNRLPEAIFQYEEGLRLNPNFADAQVNLGNALASSGRLHEAVAHCEAALKIDPDIAEAHNNLGNALFQLGRVPEATDQFKRALQLKPDYPDAHYNLGAAFVRLHRLPEAVAEYEAALRLKPDYPQVHNSLGLALVDLDRLPEAIAHFQTAVRDQPDYIEAHFDLGNALRQSRQLPAAISEYETVLRLDPNHVGAHDNLGMILAQTNRVPEAIVHFREATRLDPANASIHVNLGSALFLSGQTAQAIGEYEAALRLDPNAPDAARDLAVARQALAAPR